ncbi:MAG: small ribosomal subunit biogenesis GTPase RsgA [Thiotrichales bacterium]|nr:MAG: small ribosomal subunit biogenesis GTPase RsgA [Thiotrichales bacterium]
MAKRRLTERQKRQISANKNQKATATGAAQHNGIVITHHGKELIVRSDTGETLSCQLRQNLGTIVCGDRVVFEYIDPNSEPRSGIVIALAERRNLLQKSGFAGKAKAVAANIDQVIVVCSLVPKPNSYLIDRYLVAAENLPARPLIIINKIDLLDEQNEHVVNDINAIYESIGYRVLETSATRNTGIDELQSMLVDSTSILVGLSGVGKSSIVKDLLPDIDIRIGEISQASSEGKHTTTVSTFYTLPTGGNLIDSPGVRDFSPIDLDREQILKGFIELKPYRGSCKFANCSHTNEPGCAITEALEEGKVNQQRVNSFRKMLADTDA